VYEVEDPADTVFAVGALELDATFEMEDGQTKCQLKDKA
jgi:hypothetical protein